MVKIEPATHTHEARGRFPACFVVSLLSAGRLPARCGDDYLISFKSPDAVEILSLTAPERRIPEASFP
jgi:hypothetical protein